MTTVADRRVELVEAFHEADIRSSDSPGDTAAPVVHIFGDGITDLRRIGAGQLPYGFRLVLQPDGGTTAVQSANLATFVQRVLAVLRALSGWQVVEVSPDVMRKNSTGGADYLSVDVRLNTNIDL